MVQDAQYKSLYPDMFQVIFKNNTDKDINLVPNMPYGSEQGYGIDKECQITAFKSIICSYTTFEGETWSNPHLNDFKTLCEGKKLNK